MADIAKSGTPSLSTTNPSNEVTLGGRIAGEAIAAGDACYINSNGKIYRSTGAAANAAADVHGYAATAAQAGEAVTLFFNVRFNYGAGLTPGTKYYLSGTTVGGLADAASTGGTKPIGFAVDATRIYLFLSRY